MTLSVCLIVKNEQDVIARCLDCVKKFADEIVVADTGSTDNTRDIVKEYTSKVYDFEWCDDFSSARNFAFGMAEGDLVMWLDADDVITDENCEKIKTLKQNFADYDMAVLPYAAGFDGETPTFVYNRERIFRRSAGYRFEGAVHEAVVPSGRILYSDAIIYHKKIKSGDALRNLRIYQKLISSGEKLSGRQKFYYGRELMYNKMYHECISVLEDFLSGEGWKINKSEACYNLYQAYNEIGDSEKAYGALLKSLLFVPPDSRFCCTMGDKFLSDGDDCSAIYWFERALTADDAEKEGGFTDKDFGGFIPLMQLCVLYDRAGDVKKAFAMNELAGKIKPDNVNFLNNKKYFENLFMRDI